MKFSLRILLLPILISIVSLSEAQSKTAILTAGPITASAVTGSNKACLGSASASPNIQQFTAGGTNLSGNILVTAPSNFEVSVTAASGYASSLTLTQSGGTVNSTTIYVRSAATAAAGALSGNVTLTSSSTPTVTVAVTGTVTPTPTVNTVSNQTVCNNAATTAVTFSGAVAGTVYNWTNNTTSIGLAASGTGNIASFTATNTTNAPVTATVTVTPTYPINNNALVFNGSNKVSITNTPTIPTSNSPYTIEAWVKPNTVSGANGIVGWGNWRAQNEVNALRFDGPTRIVNYWWGFDLTVTIPNVLDGQWHHIVATCNGTTRSIYMDGVLRGSDNPGTHNVTITNNLHIAETLSGELFDGAIDEVRIWNVGRTQAQIQTNMNSTVAVNSPGLAAYYQFDEGTGTIATDNTGNGNSGTLTNSPIWMVPSSSPIAYSTTCSGTPTNFTYTVNPSNTITLTSAPATTSQTVAVNTPITNITYSTTGATGATFSGLPAGVNGSWASNAVTISGSPTAMGTFNYTVTLTGGCGTITATGTITVVTTLAIKLSSFTATISNCNTLLKWISQQETDSKYYQVEVSKDGSIFSTVGVVKAASTSGTPVAYSFTDKMPLDGNRFYRLKMVSNDGLFEYSNIVIINNKCHEKSVQIYPNPVMKNQFLVVYVSGAYVGTIRGELMSISGQLIRSFTLQNGTNTLAIQSIAPGNYMMHVTEVSTGEHKSFKVVVIK